MCSVFGFWLSLTTLMCSSYSFFHLLCVCVWHSSTSLDHFLKVPDRAEEWKLNREKDTKGCVKVLSRLHTKGFSGSTLDFYDLYRLSAPDRLVNAPRTGVRRRVAPRLCLRCWVIVRGCRFCWLSFCIVKTGNVDQKKSIKIFYELNIVTRDLHKTCRPSLSYPKTKTYTLSTVFQTSSSV